MTKRTKKQLKINGQYVHHLADLIRSPAWQVLSLPARRLLDRIEIEYLRHDGQDNGQLAVTFNDFVNYGIHRHHVPLLLGNASRSVSWSSPGTVAPVMPSFARPTCSGCLTSRRHLRSEMAPDHKDRRGQSHR
jgi:hypothetical protein